MKISLIAVIALLAFSPAVEKPLIAGQFSSFKTDELGNIYVIRGDELELYRADGSFWMRNSIKTIGTIHTLDVFYSLKPMLYSQELQQLAVLDNTLSIQGDLVWLNRRGFPQVNLLASSVQNHFWLYDQLDMQLIRVDRQWTAITQTGRLDQLLGLSLEPVQLVEYENQVYLNDPANGVLVFDLFGTYVKTIPITGAAQIQVRRNGIFFTKEGLGYKYDMRHFQISELPLPTKEISQVRMENNRILYLTDSGIHIYEP